MSGDEVDLEGGGESGGGHGNLLLFGIIGGVILGGVRYTTHSDTW